MQAETTIDGGAAFPRPHSQVETSRGTDIYAAEHGMTLRDYMAAKAMQGIKSNPELCRVCAEAAERMGVTQADAVAQMAYQDADAMLAARLKD